MRTWLDVDARTWAIRSVRALVVVLGLAGLSTLFRAVPCGGLAPAYPPIIAFEFARTQSDLFAIFGAEPSACRDAMVLAMDLTNVADTFVFMPAYGAFLLFGFLSYRAKKPEAARLAMVAVSVALVADVGENSCLLALTPELTAGPALSILPFVAGAKWLALGAAALPQAVLLWAAGWRARALSALGLLAPLAAVLAVVFPTRFGPFAPGGIAAAWIALAVTVVLRRRALAREEPASHPVDPAL
jgi:hypothetical protein